MGGDKISGAWCQLIGLEQVVGSKEGCTSQCSFEERCSMREEIPTGVVERHRRTSTQVKWQKGKETK
jgi:hypothetical protein